VILSSITVKYDQY